MDERKKEKYKKKMINRKIELLADIKQISKESLRKSLRDSVGDLSNYSFHMADVGTESYQREVNLGIASNEQEELYEIDEALQRMKEGEYGKCEMCEKKIKQKRLEARPHSKYCIKCQEEEEKKGK